MTSIIAQRLNAVRRDMAVFDLDAFIVPRADEYLGEYVPERNERLLWISGFTGSAGMVILLKDSAAIFVDGRYTVQVRQQVDGELFQVFSLIDDPQPQWLVDHLPAGSKVGFDPRVHSLAWQRQCEKVLTGKGLALVEVSENPLDKNWHDRPAPGKSPVFAFSNELTGAGSEEKRRQIAGDIEKAGADVALIAALDSIAWLLNIRSLNIPRLPVVPGTALLFKNGDMVFYTDTSLLPENIEGHVGPGVRFAPEKELTQGLQSLDGKTLLADPHHANAWCQLIAQRAGAVLLAGDDPVAIPKARKNTVELEGIRNSHLHDGVAVSRFLAWLDREVAAGRYYDEGILADKLLSFRQQNEIFQEPSFDTISATGGNAAMCHYNHADGVPATMQPDSIYLLDSGGQYLGGTTDVTRTIAIGNVPEDHKRRVTQVLKGHIALSRARFPEGTSGSQLDALARQFLWQDGCDYDHGTGHGVGHFLSVHEGPQRIAKANIHVALQSGMVVSNEPGYYRTDEFGVRIENLIAVRPCKALKGAERNMLEFETLTLIPMDVRLFDKSLMTTDEVHWLNDYHQTVRDALSEYLQGEDRIWLEKVTAAI